MPIPDDRSLDIAAFRHRLIAAALEAEGEGLVAALRDAAVRPHRNPVGREVRVSLATLWKWLAAYRQGGLLALRPKARKDKGTLRAFPAAILEAARKLRQENPHRATRTIIDLLVRIGAVARGQVARSTLDRHLDRAGYSRKWQGTLAQATFRQIATHAPFELVVTDFHHGPYVRVGPEDQAKRALFGGFIDHYSRYVPEGRYYLTEDFVALRFGFRRLLAVHGLPEKLYMDNGPAFQAIRFHAGCNAMGVRLVHSRPYQAEGRGVIERFNRTLLEQFESEVRIRETLPTLDELNAWLEAWLAERYHRDLHSMTGQTPLARFGPAAAGRPAPALELVEEYLRLRETRTVHRKWSTAEVEGRRFVVNPALRGRRVQVLYDPTDWAYVLIAYDGRIIERAEPQKAGQVPPPPEPSPAPAGAKADYLALLRADHERRLRTELTALRLQPAPATELDLPGLVALLEACREAPFGDRERSAAAALWRKLRPLEPRAVERCLDGVHRRLGPGLHLSVYLQALEDQLGRLRAGAKPQGGKP